MSSIPTSPSEPLRQFLVDTLPEKPVTLKDNWLITEVLCVYRIQTLDNSDERYRYSTTHGCSYGMAVALARLGAKMLEDFEDFGKDEDEEDEDG